MLTKEQLLKELAARGIDIDKPVRKTRADAGQPRGTYKPRSDKGKLRGSYINTAAKYKAVYERMLTSHQTSAGDGSDTLTRDANSIFPPNQDRYYRKIKGKDREYYANLVKPAHIEQARWRWLMAEYAESDLWREHIANWYFIKPDEIDNWMYTEWAWAYVHRIGGDENRLRPDPIILSYDDYVAGHYNGRPEFDSKGDIIWKK